MHVARILRLALSPSLCGIGGTTAAATLILAWRFEMSTAMLPLILAAIAFVLYFGIVTLLVRKYYRTHDVGLVWLGVAVVVWPLLNPLLAYGFRVYVNRFGSRPFETIGELAMTIAYAQQVLGLTLLLVAVFCSCKTQRNLNNQVA